MIDPTCGSGHFLLGGFARLFALWNEAMPGEVPSVIAQHALDQVFGVDLNPNVVAIARFRLLLAAFRACGPGRTSGSRAPTPTISKSTSPPAIPSCMEPSSTSLGLTSHPVKRTFETEEVFRDELKHHYEVEDVEALRDIAEGWPALRYRLREGERQFRSIHAPPRTRNVSIGRCFPTMSRLELSREARRAIDHNSEIARMNILRMFTSSPGDLRNETQIAGNVIERVAPLLAMN